MNSSAIMCASSALFTLYFETNYSDKSKIYGTDIYELICIPSWMFTSTM